MTISRRTAAARQTRLVVALSARRFINRFGAFFRSKPTKQDGAVRRATSRKGGVGIALLVLFVVPIWMLIAYASSANLVQLGLRGDRDVLPIPLTVFNALERTERGEQEAGHADPRDEGQLQARVNKGLRREASRRGWNDDQRREYAATIVERFEREGLSGFTITESFASAFTDSAHRAWPDAPHEDGTLRLIGFLTTLLYAAIVFVVLSAAAAEFGQIAGSVEWLFTLPSSAKALFLARLLSHALLNPFLWILALPFHFALFQARGFDWGAALSLAVAATIALAVVIGSLRLALEIHFAARGRRPRNVQAALSVLGSLGFLGLMWIANQPELPQWIRDVAASWPAELQPSAIAVLLCRSDASTSWFLGVGTCGAGVAAIAAFAAIGFAERKVRGGLRAGSGELEGRRSVPGAPLPIASEGERRGAIRSALGKELRMMLRERTVLVQVLLVPAAVFLSQLAFNRSLAHGVGSDSRHAAALAFGLGAYLLIFGAARSLAVESGALWMHFSFPRPLHSNLVGVTTLWAVIAVGYVAVAFVAFSAFGSGVTPEGVGVAAFAVAGAAIHAFIASAVGALGTDPLETEPRKRVRPGTLYFYMLVATVYTNALYSPSWWTKAVQVVLTALLALALWQKLGERLPYLLDPIEMPRSRIGLVEGMLAVLAFFIAQAMFAILFQLGGIDTLATLSLAYALAGAAVTLVAAVLLQHHRVADWPRIVGLRRSSPPDGAQEGVGSSPVVGAAEGVGLGLVFGALGIAYLTAIRRVPWIAEQLDEAGSAMPADGAIWVLFLAVVAAPLCEEFLFRGLLFRGMQRVFTTPQAIVASAVIFAAVHPPLSAVPVFLLGIATAWLFARRGTLLGPVLLHAVYNAIVVGFQLRA